MRLQGLPRKRDVMWGYVYTNPLLYALAPLEAAIDSTRMSPDGFVELNKWLI